MTESDESHDDMRNGLRTEAAMNSAMLNRMKPVQACGVIAVILALALPAFSADNPKITATTSEPTASDLASALGVQWWSYNLRFDSPVAGVSARLCELRRQPDSSWQHRPLSDAFAFTHGEADVRQLAVTVFIQDKAPDYDFALRLGKVFSRSKCTTKPDFSRTYTVPTVGRFISGCLVLAIEEKEEHVSTMREENMVRIIALEITTR
jgi:hypothetical protein